MIHCERSGLVCMARLCLQELCTYLGEGLVIRAGEVVLVEVLGIEDNRTRMVGGAR